MKKEQNKKSKNTGLKNPLKKQKPVYKNFYYMTPNENGTVENIKDAFFPMFEEGTEIWPEVQVLEITLENQTTITLEPMEFDYEEDLAFLEQHKIRHVYGLEVETGSMDTMREIFEKVIDRCGGFICSDSDDFLPFLLGK